MLGGRGGEAGRQDGKAQVQAGRDDRQRLTSLMLRVLPHLLLLLPLLLLLLLLLPLLLLLLLLLGAEDRGYGGTLHDIHTWLTGQVRH